MKRTRLRPKSMTKQAKLKRRADLLWGQAIRARDKGCMGRVVWPERHPSCPSGPGGVLQAAHLFADSRYPATRHTTLNGALVCASFHTLIDHNEAHKEEFRHRLLGGKLEDLRRRALDQGFKWSIDYLETTMAYLENEITELEGRET